MDRRLRLVIMISLLAIRATTAWSQQQETPAGATTTTPQSSSGSQTTEPSMNATTQGQQEQSPQEAPMAPLTSAISITPGSEGSGVSYVLPSFQWTGLLTRNFTQTAASGQGQTAQSVYVGSLTLQRVRKRSQLNLDYAGGFSLYTSSFLKTSRVAPPSFGTFHKLGVTTTQSFRKLQLSLSDSFTYLPESSNGFSGFGGLSSFGGGLGGSALGNLASITPSLLPDQSILTGSSRRYSNAVVGEAEYRIGGRSQITASGTYGFLDYIDPGYINTRYLTLLTGYNYTLSARDQVSVMYTDSLILYGGYSRGILSRGVEFGYRRRLSARLTLDLQGGPMVRQVAQPQGGTSNSSFWATGDKLLYHARVGEMALTFSNFTTPGSGVVFGAETSSERFSLSHSILRKYHGTMDVGHNYSQSVGQQFSGQRQTKVETWDVGATVSHEFKDHASVYAQYNFRRQISDHALCVASNCSASYLSHVVGFGVNWHGKPIRIH